MGLYRLHNPQKKEIHDLLDPSVLQGNSLLSWQDFMPEIEMMSKFMGVIMAIIFGITFFLVGLGIMITLNMAMIERMVEFGILKAIGTFPKYIGGMMVLESLMMGILGGLIGFGMGLGLLYWLGSVGYAMTNVQMSGMVFNDSIYPIILYKILWVYPVIYAFLTPILGIWPIKKAMKQTAISMMREE